MKKVPHIAARHQLSKLHFVTTLRTAKRRVVLPCGTGNVVDPSNAGMLFFGIDIPSVPDHLHFTTASGAEPMAMDIEPMLGQTVDYKSRDENKNEQVKRIVQRSSSL